jgi:hypothetical protein
MSVIRAAYDLLGDGAGEEWESNPEYARAIAELTRDVCGFQLDQDVMLEVIRALGAPEGAA